MMRTRWYCIVVVMSQWSLGCATITTGTTQKILFESTPSGATASVTGGHSVQTPGELTLSRKNTYDVRFEKEGYLPASSHIGQRSNPMVFGNILIGGLIGLGIDSGSGAAYYLEPEKVSVTLVAAPEVAPAADLMGPPPPPAVVVPAADATALPP